MRGILNEINQKQKRMFYRNETPNRLLWTNKLSTKEMELFPETYHSEENKNYN